MSNKIKVLIAHNDERVTKEIVKSIKILNYVEIVGTAKNGEETYKEIIKLKPDMVFAKYDFEKLDGLEIINKTEKRMKEEIPTFNLFIENEEVPEKRLQETLKNVGTKLNAFVRKPYIDRVKDIIEEQIDNKGQSD